MQFSRDQMTYALNEAQRRLKSLEHELETVRKDKTTNNDHTSDAKKKKKPRVGFFLRFVF